MKKITIMLAGLGIAAAAIPATAIAAAPQPPAYSPHFIRTGGTYDECVRVEQSGADGVSTRTVGPLAQDDPGMPSLYLRGRSSELDPRTGRSEVPASRDAKRLITKTHGTLASRDPPASVRSLTKDGNRERNR